MRTFSPFLGKNAPAESVTHFLENIEWYGPAKSLLTIMIQIRNVLFTIILPLALFDCSRLLNDCRMQQFIFLKYRTFSTGHALSKDKKPDDSTMKTLGKTDSIYFYKWIPFFNLLFLVLSLAINQVWIQNLWNCI